jgi:hypothetical protein
MKTLYDFSVIADTNQSPNFTSEMNSLLRVEMPVSLSLVRMKSANGIAEVARADQPLSDAPFLNAIWNDPPALTYSYREQGGARILLFLGLLEPCERKLDAGRFVHYSTEPQAHAVEIEMPQYDYENVEPVCPCVFDWLKECRGAWNLICTDHDMFSMMVPCTFTFEDENSALEFKLTFG